MLWAHDRFGEWASGGLISPVKPGADFKAGVLAAGWDAASFDSNIWGYPVSVEAVGLVYNTDLVATPPASFEEIKDMEFPEGVTAILWDNNNTYFTMPMLMAGGGFAFQKVDGSFDGAVTGVNNQGAIAGASITA